MRTVTKIIGPTLSTLVRVAYDTETGEYVAQLVRDGRRVPDADYYTDDRDDAIATGTAMIDHIIALH